MVAVFWGGERDLLVGGLSLAAFLAVPLSLSSSFASACLLLLLCSALLRGEEGGLGLSTCVGLYRS